MISKQTARTVTPMVRSFAKSGVLPLAEVNELEQIINNACKPAKQQREKDKLIPAHNVAERLGVCRKTVLRMHKAGRLKGILVTGSKKSLKFSEKEINEFILNGGVDGYE